ncbi:GNAT family protein [Bacillus sp. 165]|uniref:GNAT family N-acetyltransferase n=1 Tax=Bacillus sp. 165 TaxID=1529117 RepID=UPI001ADD51B6|nr:GNAT family protein [Bacillus sp. 165]MBO9129969.1 GNAT family N-acetyltransferase [Bacillus sp. 165]
MFTTKNVTLRPLQESDIEQMYSWELDMEISRMSGVGRKRTYAQFQNSYESYFSKSTDSLVLFAIEFDNKLVGRAELGLIDRFHQRGAFGIVIGEKEMWGKKIGSAALTLLLDYAFHIENLQRIYAEVYDFNTRSQRLLEAAGFTYEGKLRQHEFHNGKMQDMLVYGILKEEFSGESVIVK